MASEARQEPERDRLLDAAVVEYLEAIELGAPLESAQWLARYPSLTAELQQFLSDQQEVQRWTDPLKQVANTLSLGAGSSGAAKPGISEPAGKVVGEYELLDELARGGMGVVYRARQLPLNRVVALKMILSGEMASTAELARFRREAEAFASLDHPHIMPIYEVGVHDGLPYFSMKLVDGGSLTARLPQLRGDGRAVARLMVLIARAVHHAHQRGILHRDLKPDNILVDDDGQPYVTDFGLARPVQGDSGVTQSGAIVGTPSFMAPEQAAGNQDLTTAIDIYGLGAILYVLLSGSPPFRGETPLETVRQVLEDDPSHPRLLNPRVDRDLETICMKCLRKLPDRRYGSAEAIAEDLERWLVGEPILARRASLWERTIKKARRNPMAAALMLVSTLAVVGGIASVFQFQQQEAEAELQRLTELSEERVGIERMISAGRIFLEGNEPKLAEMKLADAVEAAGLEESFEELRDRADNLRRDARSALAAQKERYEWDEKHEQFKDQHNQVIFEGTQFTGVDRPAAVAATISAAERALMTFGLDVQGGGTFAVHEHLREHEQQIIEQCYEVLLIVADAVVHQDPPQLDQALRLLDQAARLRPLTQSFHERSARYLYDLFEPDAAAAEEQLAQALQPSSALDFFLLGDDLLRRRQPRLAVEQFERALSVKPDHFWARYLAGICRLQLQHYQLAKEHFTACLIEEHDMRAWVYLHRGIANTRLPKLNSAEGDFNLAYELYEHAARHDDLLYSIFVNRGVLYRKQQRYSAAITDLHAAIQHKPGAFQAYLNLANVYVDRDYRTEAARQLGRAIEVATDLVAAGELRPLDLCGIYHRRVLVLWERDRSAALADLHIALEVQEYADGYFRLGEHLQGKQQFEAAIAAYTKAENAEPLPQGNYRRALNLGQRAECELYLERYQAAARTLDSYAVEVGHRNAYFYQLRGLARTKLGDYSDAAHDYTLALAISPDDLEMHTQRGWVYYLTGANKLAEKDFQTAIQKNSQSSDPYAGRGCARVSLGQHAEATADAEESLLRGGDPPQFRTLWNAARIYATATRVIDWQLGGSKYEPKTRKRYFDRAMELVRQATEKMPAEEASKGWREYFENEPGFDGIRSSPAFARLGRTYLRPAAGG